MSTLFGTVLGTQIRTTVLELLVSVCPRTFPSHMAQVRLCHLEVKIGYDELRPQLDHDIASLILAGYCISPI